MSPDYNESGEDPDPIPNAAIEDPQSLNLYSYVLNNPLSDFDPDGHVDCATRTQDVVCIVQTVWNWLKNLPGPQQAEGAYKEVSNEFSDMGDFIHQATGEQRAPEARYQITSHNQQIGALVAGVGMLFVPGGDDVKALKLMSRDELLAEITNPELRKTIEQLYREGATIGDGSTAAAVEHESATGQAVGGRWHTIKAEESVTRLKRLLRNQNLSPRERTIVNAIIQRTEAALGYGGPI